VLQGNDWLSRRVQRQGSSPKDFKKFLTKEYWIQFDEELLRSAAPQDVIRDDFLKLLEVCRQASLPH
jgi:hypothetical protein